MPKQIVTLMCLVLLPCLLKAERGDVVFDATEWDFGRIGVDAGAVSHTFRMRNMGKDTVTIGSLAPSCSCVIVRMADKVLAPGEEGEMEFVLSPTATPGMTLRTVDVYDAGGTHLALLSVTVEVVVSSASVRRQYPVMLDEALFADRRDMIFGYVYWGQEKERQMGIYNPTAQSVELKVRCGQRLPLRFKEDCALPKSKELEEVSLRKWRLWEVDCPKVLGPGERAVIRLRCMVPADCGEYTSFDDELAIYVNGRQTEKGIGTSGIVMREIVPSASAPSLWTVPSLAAMRYEKRHKRYRGVITLGNAGDAPLLILDVKTAADTNVKAGTVILPGEMKEVEAVTPTGEARIEIFTDDPVRPYKELLYKH